MEYSLLKGLWTRRKTGYVIIIIIIMRSLILFSSH